MKNRVAISTLTSRNKIDYWKMLIESMERNLPGLDLDWYVYSNGSDREQQVFLSSPLYGPNFWVQFGATNEGVGYGMNRAADMVKDYEYVLFIVDDWYHLSEEETGYNSNWLKECVEFLDENQEVDGIVLRKYMTRTEICQHNHYEMFNLKDKYIDFKSLKLLDQQNLVYSNAPHLRRNKPHYEKEIFPQKQDGLARKQIKPVGRPWALEKEIEGWSEAERPEAIATGKSRINKINLYGLINGIFTHEFNPKAWANQSEADLGCGLYKSGISTCKYGLWGWTRYPKAFCEACSHERGIGDFYEHMERYYKGTRSNKETK
jgi:hypothetical protein